MQGWLGASVPWGRQGPLRRSLCSSSPPAPWEVCSWPGHFTAQRARGTIAWRLPQSTEQLSPRMCFSCLGKAEGAGRMSDELVPHQTVPREHWRFWLDAWSASSLWDSRREPRVRSQALGLLAQSCFWGSPGSVRPHKGLGPVLTPMEGPSPGGTACTLPHLLLTIRFISLDTWLPPRWL